MDSNQKLTLGNVQKTLFLPAWGRAVETKKEPPLLVDDTAVEIMEKIGYDFAPMAQNLQEISRIAWIKRSLLTDHVVEKFLSEHPDGTIINIGCGMETTFERTDNGRVRWYDLDLPDVIEIRKQFLKETDRRTFLATSFLDEAWLNEIEHDGNVLFISAGVFYYFEEDDVKTFFLRLLEKIPGSEIVFDVSSPLGVKMANRTVISASGMDEGSFLVWGVQKTEDILAWDARIQMLAKFKYYQSGIKGIMNILMGRLSDRLGMQYMLHLKLG